MSSAARSRVDASSATGWSDSSPATATHRLRVERVDHGLVGLGPDHYVDGIPASAVLAGFAANPGAGLWVIAADASRTISE